MRDLAQVQVQFRAEGTMTREARARGRKTHTSARARGGPGIPKRGSGRAFAVEIRQIYEVVRFPGRGGT